MPLGTECNRTDLNKTGTTYKDGSPVTLPHEFGTPVNLPHDFGNDIPSSGTNENDVTWSVSPAHFGNINPNGTPTPPPPTPTFLAIVNAGFESQIITPSTWADDAGGTSGSQFLVPIGWTYTLSIPGVGDIGIEYTAIGGALPPGVLAPEGNNIGYLYPDSNFPLASSCQQILSDTWLASKTYTITFDAILDLDNWSNNGTVTGIVQLLNGATVLFDSGLFVDSAAVNGVYPHSFSYTTPSSGAMIGQPITIKFISSDVTAADPLLIDDVQLSYV